MTPVTQTSSFLCSKWECWYLPNQKVAGKIKWNNKYETNLKNCHRFKLWGNNIPWNICCIFLHSHIFSKTKKKKNCFLENSTSGRLYSKTFNLFLDISQWIELIFKALLKYCLKLQWKFSGLKRRWWIKYIDYWNQFVECLQARRHLNMSHLESDNQLGNHTRFSKCVGLCSFVFQFLSLKHRASPKSFSSGWNCWSLVWHPDLNPLCFSPHFLFLSTVWNKVQL